MQNENQWMTAGMMKHLLLLLNTYKLRRNGLCKNRAEEKS